MQTDTLDDGAWLTRLHAAKLASLAQLTAGVTHEINSPVDLLVGSMAVLRERLATLRALAGRHADDELAALVDRIGTTLDVVADGAARTAAVVGDLRAFAGPHDVGRVAVDLHEAVELALYVLRPRWSDRIVIHRRYAALPSVPGIPARLNQVVANVLANACDAIPGHGNVFVETGRDGADAVLSVRDDGVGIPPAHLHRIFDPFFTTKPQGHGVGLGLSIVHGIVTAHGGRIAVESAPGRGTTFRLLLPLGRAAAAGRQASGVRKLDSHTRAVRPAGLRAGLEHDAIEANSGRRLASRRGA